MRTTNTILWIFTVLLFFMSPLWSQAVDAKKPSTLTGHETIVVTANGFSVDILHANRDILVLDRTMIDKLPVRSIVDLLDYINGFYLRTRGPHGVQSDVQVRGGTFEQVLILLDGIPVNDPQTGHFNMDLPLALEDVDHIEITRGATLHPYGSLGMGGILHIITRRHSSHPVTMDISAGQVSAQDVRGRIVFPIGRNQQGLSFLRSTNGDYRPNTDQTRIVTAYRGDWTIGSTLFQGFAGFFSKKFGANSFYTEKFPLQWESDRGGLVSWTSRTRLKKTLCETQTAWRLHRDHFLLDRSRPEFFDNRHTTQTFHLGLSCSVPGHQGATLIGIQWDRSNLRSNSLGRHHRTTSSLYGTRQQMLGQRVSMDFGGVLRIDSGQWRFRPSFDIGVDLAEHWHAYAATGWSFRLPSFTELFYRSPANLGNPDLQTETAWNIEAGLRYVKARERFALVAFYRRQSHIIDWLRPSPEVPWHATNLGSISLRGLHFDGDLLLGLALPGLEVNAIGLGYSYSHADKPPVVFESKYVLTFLRHQVLAKANLRWFHWIHETVILHYQIPYSSDPRWIVDTRWAVPFSSFDLYLDVTNVFNRTIESFPGVILPGRWVRLGLRMKF